MNAEALLAALDLSEGSRVDQRVPKKLLLENGAPTAADKRYINEGIEELQWVAALKPTTIGVPEYRNDVREYLEIAVMRLALRPAAKKARLIELVHRAIPYPVLLLAVHGDRPGLSVAHKRWSQGEAGKTVLDGDLVTIEWDAARDREWRDAFGDALALRRQPRSTLYALYQGWLDTLLALHAARVTGAFALLSDAAQAAARNEAMREYARLEVDIARVRGAAAKEKQMSRQVKLNVEVKRLEAARAIARGRI